jgi:SulP family sulfate permease
LANTKAVGQARRAIGGWWSSNRPKNRTELRSEAVAGIPGAIGSVPDGMAASVLTGVNPIYGLYASFAGPIVGGVFSSTRLMVVTTTSAAALAAGSALEGVPEGERAGALFMLTILAGVFMALAGVFRLGRYTRFVSQSVMVGFLTGVGVNIILSQLVELTGGRDEGNIALTKAINVVLHPSDMYLPTLAVGLGALALVAWGSMSRFASYAALVALVIPTALIELLGTPGLKRVEDVGEIPSGIPLPHLPNLSDFALSIVPGALAVAAIVLVQGAGVAESAPNDDGTRSDTNQDFIAQGAGNIAAGFFQGQPVGGSVGQTALNASAGARTRWASIFSGIWMFVILVAFSGAVGVVVMACLAAVLIYAALGSLRFEDMKTVWWSGRNSEIAMVTTFAATLTLPIAAAVGLGVALSLMLQLNTDLADLRLVQLRRRDDGAVEEVPAPAVPPDHAVLVIEAQGSLKYAGARTLQQKLPDPTGSIAPVVVLRLRGRQSLGATFITIISHYSDQLTAVGGRLILSGVSIPLHNRIERAGGQDLGATFEIFDATSVLGESTTEAIEAAEHWLEDTPRRRSTG